MHLSTHLYSGGSGMYWPFVYAGSLTAGLPANILRAQIVLACADGSSLPLLRVWSALRSQQHTERRLRLPITLAGGRVFAHRYGCTLTYKGVFREYRVNFQGGTEATAYYTNDLSDALLSVYHFHRYTSAVTLRGDAILSPGPTF